MKKFTPSSVYKAGWALCMLAILISVAIGGFSIWLYAVTAIWVVLLYMIKKSLVEDTFAYKKSVVWMVIVSLLSVTAFSFMIEDDEAWRNYSDLTFSSDFEWSPELMEGYASQENQLEMSYAGPFYFGEFEGLNEYTRQYGKARNWRTKEIFKLVDETVRDLNQMEDAMMELRGTLDWYGFEVISRAPEAQETILEMLDSNAMNSYLSKQKLEIIDALSREIECPPENAEEGFLCYTLYTSVHSLIESYNDEIITLNGNIALIYFTLEQEPELYEDLNDDLDDVMDPLMDDVNELMHRIHYNGASLAFEEKLLFTADYYFTRDALDYSKDELDRIEDMIDSYDGENELVSNDELEFMEELHEHLAAHVEELEDYLDSIDEDELVAIEELAFDNGSIVPKAYAIGNPFTWLGSNLKKAANAAVDAGAAGANLAWSATKTAVSKTKDLTIATVKHIGTNTGVVLDTIDATVKTAVDTSLNVYYGASSDEIMRDIKNNYKQVSENYRDGKSGSEIYQNSVKVMESLEKVPEILVEKAIGKGYTSKALGFVGKTTVGFVTGAAKDMYVVLDPGASEADTLVGLAGLVMTAAGGTQSVLKGSQALNLTKKSTKGLANKAMKIAKDINGKKIKKVFKDGILGTFKKAFSKNSLQNFGSKSRRVMERTYNNMKQNAKLGYRYLRKNVNSGAPSAYKTTFSETTYKNAFKTFFGLAEDGAPLTKHLIGYADNVLGATLDDQVKNTFKSMLTSVGVSDLGISLLDKQVQDNLIEQKQLVLRQTWAEYEQEKREEEKQEEDYGATDDHPMGDGIDGLEVDGKIYSAEDYYYDDELGCYLDSEGYVISCDDEFYDTYGDYDYSDDNNSGDDWDWNWDFEYEKYDDYDYDGEDGYYDDGGSDGDEGSYDPEWYQNPNLDGNRSSGSVDCDDITLGNISDCLETTQF